tara:strand:- start:463 stop:735 length:273 start_codon:yes stop_codon:yes gene_type:complete
MKKIIYSFLIMISLLLVSCDNYSKEQLEKEVKLSIQAKQGSVDEKVLEVSLVETSENQYEGFVNTIEYGEEYQYNITVVVDGDEFIWEVY